MFDKALSKTLLPKKEIIFLPSIEVFLLENSLKKSANLKFLIFPC